MKRSKIFLGITTGVLALVAFTAAKTAKYTHLAKAYYSANGSNCTLSAGVSYNTSNVSPRGNQATLGVHPLYTFKEGFHCSSASPLYTSTATD